MDDIIISEVHGKDVLFNQEIDNETVTAAAGGVAVNGDVDDSAINTGINSGIMAGDDVDLDDSIVGDHNTQLNDSWIGAFAGKGDATNAQGENVNLGSGQLIDVDAKGDAQVVTGNGNDVRGEVDVDLEHVDGPVNVAAGDENRQYGFEDKSTNVEDSFNTTTEVDDSFNTLTERTELFSLEDNDQVTKTIADSFNTDVEVNHTDLYTETETYTDDSSYENSETWRIELQQELEAAHAWADDDYVGE